jgi:hypothetical protein
MCDGLLLLSGVADPKERKEVETMTYEKPEVAALGDATLVIQSTRQISSEVPPNQGLKQFVGDSELDD